MPQFSRYLSSSIPVLSACIIYVQGSLTTLIKGDLLFEKCTYCLSQAISLKDMQAEEYIYDDFKNGKVSPGQGNYIECKLKEPQYSVSIIRKMKMQGFPSILV